VNGNIKEAGVVAYSISLSFDLHDHSTMLGLFLKGSVLAIVLASSVKGFDARKVPHAKQVSNDGPSIEHSMCTSSIRFYSSCDAKQENLVLLVSKSKGQALQPIHSKYAAKIKAVKVPLGCKATLYTDSAKSENYSAAKKSLGLLLKGPELKCFAQLKVGHHRGEVGFLSIGIEDNVDIGVVAHEIESVKASMEKRIDSLASTLGKEILDLKKDNTILRNKLNDVAARKGQGNKKSTLDKLHT
jgi:hypothetical protein